MKQEVKTKLTKERIIQAGVQIFGTNGYAASTLNDICNSNGIPKGLLYHNFAGKDDLYLACVSHCFSKVMGHFTAEDIQNDLEKYMHIRFQYFSNHPHHARIFFEAILQPPSALKEQIRELRADFDLFNRRIYQSALLHMELRSGVTEDDALFYYEIMQEMFNGYFSSPAYAGKGFEFIVAEHENKLVKMLDFMLYGIVDRECGK